MKKLILIIGLFIVVNLQSQWEPVGDKIKTTWSENIDPNNTLF